MGTSCRDRGSGKPGQAPPRVSGVMPPPPPRDLSVKGPVAKWRPQPPSLFCTGSSGHTSHGAAQTEPPGRCPLAEDTTQPLGLRPQPQKQPCTAGPGAGAGEGRPLLRLLPRPRGAYLGRERGRCPGGGTEAGSPMVQPQPCTASGDTAQGTQPRSHSPATAPGPARSRGGRRWLRGSPVSERGSHGAPVREWAASLHRWLFVPLTPAICLFV